jgi:hypothetical protein
MSMLKKTGLAVALAGMLAVAAMAADKIHSGLKAGEQPGAFQVVDVNGPHKGQQLCYRCNYGRAAVVAAFIKGDAADATAVVTQIQKLTDQYKSKELRSFVVFMGGPELKPKIQQIAAEHHITVPLTFLPQGTGAADVQAYQINPEASNTVMLWNKMAVHTTVVNADKGTWPQVSKAAAEMLK